MLRPSFCGATLTLHPEDLVGKAKSEHAQFSPGRADPLCCCVLFPQSPSPSLFSNTYKTQISSSHTHDTICFVHLFVKLTKCLEPWGHLPSEKLALLLIADLLQTK